MTEFADDVAKALHRRMRRRRFTMFGAAAAIIAFVIYFVTCGHGFGLGGAGKGSGVAPAPTSDAGPHRCIVRVQLGGYLVDGKPASRDVVVTTCAATTGAEVTVTGDARQGDWDELRAALEAAHVAILIKHE